MAFKPSSVVAGPTPLTSAKPVGGRYAAIRPPGQSTPLIKAGEYVLVLVDSRGSRKGTTACIKAKVLEAVGDGCTPPSDEVHQIMINFGGKAFDVGIGRIVALVMAICNCETYEQLVAEEPNYDELVDIICGTRADSKTYGDNPLAGVKVCARGWNSASLSQRGDPFVNWEFAIPA